MNETKSSDDERAELIRERIEAGSSVLDICHELKISPQAVYKRLDILGIDSPSKRQATKGENDGISVDITPQLRKHLEETGNDEPESNRIDERI